MSECLTQPVQELTLDQLLQDRRLLAQLQVELRARIFAVDREIFSKQFLTCIQPRRRMA